MNAFHLLSQRLQSLNLIREIEDILNEMDEKVVTLVQGQLAEGRRGDGLLLPPYKESTKLIKQMNNTILMGDRIALIDTGEFWKGFFATTYKGGIEVDSKDWKRDMLVERYGEEVFQVARDSLETLVEEMLPSLQKKVHDYLSR